MPPKARLFLPQATYHVYCRVARGEFVFDDLHEAEAFVDAARNVRDLPWWVGAEHVDEIVSDDLRSQAETYDGLSLEEERS